MVFSEIWKREIRNCGLAIAALGSLFASAAITRADVVWIAGQDEPIFGIVESSDAQQVMFRQTSDGQEFTLRFIKRTDIQTMVVNHDPQTLASLQPGDWDDWLRLSEELYSQRRDPVARDLAMRLLIVVAGNSDHDAERRSAFAALLPLARSDVEREQLMQLRYLETGEGEVRPRDVDSSKQIGNAEKERVAALVRRVRLQQIQPAELSKNAEAKRVVSSLEEVCSWEELLRLSRINRIDDESLRRLVELEFSLRRRNQNGPTKKPTSEWHLLANRIGGSELELPTIENVTEFDPQATQFADGKWSRP